MWARLLTGTLGDGASLLLFGVTTLGGCTVFAALRGCTLGDWPLGVFSTLGSWPVGAGCVGDGTSFSCAANVVARFSKMLVSWRNADCWMLSLLGVIGVGPFNAWVQVCNACVSASVDDVVGMAW